MTYPAGKIIQCGRCGISVAKKSGHHLYCRDCSANAHREARLKWDRKSYTKRPEVLSAVTIRGREINETERLGLVDVMRPIDLAWMIRVCVPFDVAASKNYIYGFRQDGHVRLREQVKAYRDLIGFTLKAALRNQPIKHNKVWLDILVQKPNHQADAVNFVDTICDAVKRVIPVDDRWFALRRLDWQIVKDNPQIFLGIGQEEGVEDAQACSSCGRVLALTRFVRHRATKLGFNRNCKDCLAAVRL